jgi:ATPase subunit of ABC transporter with duplicated ATPase domains
MAASLIARSVTVSRGPLTVLDSVDLTLAPGRRVGLVGPNGVGKSTLLAALVGQISPDSGSIDLAPATANVGLLPQEPARLADETVREFLARRTGVTAAQLELDEAAQGLADGSSGADDRYADGLDRWLALGAADFDARVGEVWSSLGLADRLLDQPTDTLSGGEAARSSLASLLLSRFDIVLLDEPTNDLDLDGLERLEQWVLGLDAPVFLVSHDRTFLQRTITDVVEIDHHTHRASWFAGGWDALLAERDLAKQHAREAFVEFDGKRQNLLDRAQREREWASQGASKVRKSGETDKHIKHFKMNQTEQLAGKAARTQKAIERLDAVEEPHEQWELQLTIPDAPRSGDVVADCTAAVVDRGDYVLGPVDLSIAYGDRVALVGANGTGKTTLIELLLGRIEPTAGSARLGRSVVVGEIEQARAHLLGDASLVEAFAAAVAAHAATGPGDTVADTRTLLAKFGLGAEHVNRRVGTLSPGERTRASLALLMRTGANLLVLDEPTNHLDIEAIEQLEQALETFAGTVVLVTHDRALLERVRTTRTLELRDGNVIER